MHERDGSFIAAGRIASRLSNVDWILQSSYEGSPAWKRPFQPRIVEKVLREAPCNVALLHVRTRFNCEADWGAVTDIISALQYTGLLKPTNFPRPASA
ncbi:MAG: hypothetical protein JWR19_2310 [Pedosphaera sp.]|nr:hypothetical protein [Pedosphaera sp.]